MKTRTYGKGSVQLWLSANDTYSWANRDGARWPCSELANRRLYVEFDSRGDLVELSIDGGRGEQDVSANELNALCADYLQGAGVPLPKCLESASRVQPIK